MSTALEKKHEQNPESFNPKKPEIANMMEAVSSERILEKLYSGETNEYFEIIKHDGYRFIGKSAYASLNKFSDIIIDATWKCKEWIKTELDKLSEYNSDDTNFAGLITWELYSGGRKEYDTGMVFRNELRGYCVGKYMKPGCPVPKEMDYVDIPPGYVGKWFGNYDGEDDTPEFHVREKIEETGFFEPTSWIWMADVRPEPKDGKQLEGYYVSCVPASEEKQRLTRIKNLILENLEQGLAELDIEFSDDSAALSKMCNDVAFELRQQKEYDKALALYEKALAVDPNQDDQHFSRHGVTYQLMGNHEKAIELFTKALEMGKSRGARLDRGISYFALGKIAEAVSDYHALRAQLEEENDSNWKQLPRLYELVKGHL